MYFNVRGRHGLRHDITQAVFEAVIMSKGEHGQLYGMTQAVLKYVFLSRIEHGLEHSMMEAVQRTGVIFWHILWLSQGNHFPIGFDPYLGIKLLFGIKLLSPILKRFLY